MNSPEKVLRLIEEMQDYSDQELAEAFPFGLPPMLLRGVLAGAAGQVPTDAAKLDEMLTRAIQLCADLRSDDTA